MRRLHLFEFEDQPWFPQVFRRGITDYLQYAANRIDLYKPVIPIIEKGLDKSGSNVIVDLCSGGGGGIKTIRKHLLNKNRNVDVFLTDKYPNIEAFRKAADESSGDIRFVETPVDAANVPRELKGFRTQFVSFHHFRPAMAHNILQDAVKANAVIGIFEATERSLVNFMAMLFTPIVVMLAVPFIRPFSWTRLLFTYLIPAIPFFTMWDGMVSVLRTYTTNELMEMARSAGGDNYRWESARITRKGAPPIVYLLGYPDK